MIGFVFPAAGPKDEGVERAHEEIRALRAAVGVLLGLDGVEVAPPGVAVAVPLRMQRLHCRMRPPQRRPVDDQALAIAVEEIVGRSAAQPFAHRPDVRLDYAAAERIVEGLEPSVGENLGWGVGLHAATFAPGSSGGKEA